MSRRGRRRSWSFSNRAQLSTDGFESYDLAVRSVFKDDVDYAQVVKIYVDPVKEIAGV